MTQVYVVYHYDQETDDDNDEEKMIGVYSTEERAQQAIERLRDKPGFRDFPERWWIDDVTLDQGSWNDGFATMYPGDKCREEDDEK